jgi:hypothetical protein
MHTPSSRMLPSVIGGPGGWRWFWAIGQRFLAKRRVRIVVTKKQRMPNKTHIARSFLKERERVSIKCGPGHKGATTSDVDGRIMRRRRGRLSLFDKQA